MIERNSEPLMRKSYVTNTNSRPQPPPQKKQNKIKVQLQSIIHDIKNVGQTVHHNLERQKIDQERKQRTFCETKYSKMLQKYSQEDLGFKSLKKRMSLTKAPPKTKEQYLKNIKKDIKEKYKNLTDAKNKEKSFYLSFDQKMQKSRKMKKNRKYFYFLMDLFKDQFENYAKDSPFHLKGLTQSFICLQQNATQLLEQIALAIQNNRNFDAEKFFSIKLLTNDEFDTCQSFFQSFFYYFLGKVSQKLCHYEASIRHLKKAKNSLKIYSNKESSIIKMWCYNNLGFNFKKISLYPLSKHYYQKYLQFSWITDQREEELDAYDKIGMAYMYMNQISKSKYFHERKVMNQYEPKNSNLKSLSLKKLQIFVYANQQINYQIAEKPEAEEKQKPIYFVEEIFNNYSSDESVKIDIPDKITMIDSYDKVNQSHHIMKYDYANFKKRNRIVANSNIRRQKEDIFVDQKIEPITFQNQNYMSKMFKSHQSGLYHLKDYYNQSSMGKKESQSMAKRGSQVFKNSENLDLSTLEYKNTPLGQNVINKLKKFENNFNLLREGILVLIDDYEQNYRDQYRENK